MAKSKKSKILAMALCASVMTGIYAAPVMAAAITVSDTSILEVGGSDGNKYTITSGTLNLDGDNIAAALNGTNLTLYSVTANTISTTGNTEVGGTLTAAGRASLSGGLTVTNDGIKVEKGGLTVVQGTTDIQDGLTVSGGATVNGGLTASDGLTVTNNGIKVEEGGLTVNAGDTTLQTLSAGTTTLDSLTVTDGQAVFKKGAFVEGELYADKAKVGAAGLEVVGDTTLKGLTAGATKVDSLGVTNDATVGGTLDVTGETTLAGLTAGATTVDSLTVKGETTLKNTKVNGTLEVNGDTTLKGLTAGATKVDSLIVKGAAKVNSLEVDSGIKAANGTFKLTEEGVLTVGGKATFTDKVTVMDGITVTGDSSVAGNFAVTGGLSVTGGKAVLNDGLTVTGDTLLNGIFDVGAGNFKVDTDGNTEINGSLNLGGRDVGAAIEALEVYADELKGANLPEKVGGIERDPGNGTTTIEKGAVFTETAMTMGDTIVESGKITVGAADNQTIIEGGAITAKSLLLDGKDVGETIFGIKREGDVTTIEGATSFNSDGMSIKNTDGFGTSLGVAGMEITAAGGLSTSFTAGRATFVGESGTTNINGGAIQTNTINGVDFSEWHSKVNGRLDVLEYKTQNIKPGAGTGTGTGAGGASGLTGGEDTITVPDTAPGHTGITGNVTVGGEINAGEIVVGDKGSDHKTTIDGGNVTVNGGENGSTTINGGNITTGDITAGTGTFDDVIIGENTTIDGTGINTVNGKFTGNVDVDGEVTVGDGTTITGEGITTSTGTFDDVIIGGNTTIDSDGINTNDITAGTGTIGNVDMDNTGIAVGVGTTITEDTVTTENIKADNGEFDSQVTVGGNTTITDGNINLGDDNGTNINADGMIVGNANGVNTNVSAGDVVITDKDGKDIALSDVGYVENIDRELQANGNYDGTVVGGINAEADIRRAEVNRLDNRISKVEDRVDKVGAMSAAIANLRTMGYDPAAPTEIAVGVGQYRSETGVALGMFHYPNKDFMLSLSVSTSGDEVMGGIGATWKFGRKSPEKVLAAEKEKAAKAKLAKAEAMKKAAKEAKIKAQQERHAKLAAERAAQAEAAK